jgi:hypothetical protein
MSELIKIYVRSDLLKIKRDGTLGEGKEIVRFDAGRRRGWSGSAGGWGMRSLLGYRCFSLPKEA